MTTKELRSYIDRILGNSLRVLLPSYWWKRLFGAVVDKVEAVQKTADSVRNDLMEYEEGIGLLLEVLDLSFDSISDDAFIVPWQITGDFTLSTKDKEQNAKFYAKYGLNNNTAQVYNIPTSSIVPIIKMGSYYLRSTLISITQFNYEAEAPIKVTIQNGMGAAATSVVYEYDYKITADGEVELVRNAFAPKVRNLFVDGANIGGTALDDKEKSENADAFSIVSTAVKNNLSLSSLEFRVFLKRKSQQYTRIYTHTLGTVISSDDNGEYIDFQIQTTNGGGGTWSCRLREDGSVTTAKSSEDGAVSFLITKTEGFKDYLNAVLYAEGGKPNAYPRGIVRYSTTARCEVDTVLIRTDEVWLDFNVDYIRYRWVFDRATGEFGWQEKISSSQVDASMSSTSTNAVQNKVVKAYVDKSASTLRMWYDDDLYEEKIEENIRVYNKLVNYDAVCVLVTLETSIDASTAYYSYPMDYFYVKNGIVHIWAHDIFYEVNSLVREDYHFLLYSDGSWDIG